LCSAGARVARPHRRGAKVRPTRTVSRYASKPVTRSMFAVTCLPASPYPLEAESQARPAYLNRAASRACAGLVVRAADAAPAAWRAVVPGWMLGCIDRSRRPPACSCTDPQGSARPGRYTSGRSRSSTAIGSRSPCSSRRTGDSPRHSCIAPGNPERTCTGAGTNVTRGCTGRCRCTAPARHRECTCICVATSGSHGCTGRSRRTVPAARTPVACTRHPVAYICRSSRCSTPHHFGRRWDRRARYSADTESHSDAGTPTRADSVCKLSGTRPCAPLATCASLESRGRRCRSMRMRRLEWSTPAVLQRAIRELSRDVPPGCFAIPYY